MKGPTPVWAGWMTPDGQRKLKDPQGFARWFETFRGKPFEIVVRAPVTGRSLDQNAWLHAAFKGWADFLGNSVDELKDEMLEIVFGTKEIVSLLTGEVRTVMVEPHTSKLDTKQFSELMERSIVEAARTGYIIELPDEYRSQSSMYKNGELPEEVRTGASGSKFQR